MGLFRRKQDADRVIDLRDVPPAPAPTSTPSVQWGSPVPCPECHGRGYLDHIDPFKEVMYLHCTSCGLRYDITKADLDSITS
jgi:uncharacterized protein (DUF983 family)